MEIGTILKSLRIEAGLSSIQVADKLRISESTYRKYETDKNSPTLNVLSEIADIYNKRVIEILPVQIVRTKGELFLSDRLDKIEIKINDMTKQIDELLRLNAILEYNLDGDK